MKKLARSYIWWPGIDMDIESKVQDCQVHGSIPAVAPLHPWNWPEKPWSRLHVDYAGPFLGHMFLIIVDAYSKWLEVYPTKASTSAVTIDKLRECFSTHGLPEMVVSDNGPCFVSEDFAAFMSENGVVHVKTSPHHPSSNGLAKRSVRIFKEGMTKMQNTEGNLNTEIEQISTSISVNSAHYDRSLAFGAPNGTSCQNKILSRQTRGQKSCQEMSN
ncbi:uncharacterized protein K02A2.6-like [Pecten maximus]|uniref:uncharacterized protein K02A2.6-like n=1 Tax=Pecten maximus TaxID=6579 RepID=UPI001457FBE8|nr:uncharacterized protein K02A2.6-like [Pecten maximus]